MRRTFSGCWALSAGAKIAESRSRSIATVLPWHSFEDRLIELLSEGGSWPALGLGHLRSAKALPALYALLDKCQQTMVVFIAYSIYQINQDAQMIDKVLKELPKITSEYALVDIQYYLGLFNEPPIKAELRKYRNDHRYLVAYNAARALGESTDGVVLEFHKKR